MGIDTHLTDKHLTSSTCKALRIGSRNDRRLEIPCIPIVVNAVILFCLMYKMCYYRFGEMQLDFRSPSGFDRTRNVEIGNKNFKLEHLEEAFTSKHWLVRIYRVKDYANRVKSSGPLRSTNLKAKSKYIPRRNNRRGYIKDKLTVVQGKRVQRKGKKKNKAKKTKKSA